MNQMNSYRILRPAYTTVAAKTLGGETMWQVRFQDTDLSVVAPSDVEAVEMAKKLGAINPVLRKENV